MVSAGLILDQSTDSDVSVVPAPLVDGPAQAARTAAPRLAPVKVRKFFLESGADIGGRAFRVDGCPVCGPANQEIHPVTDPWVSPETMYRCKAAKMIRMGRRTMTAPAMSIPQFWVPPSLLTS